MKLTPFQKWTGCLTVDGTAKAAAHDRLKHRTGEDYGYDVEKWREWGYEHPEVSGMTRVTGNSKMEK